MTRAEFHAIRIRIGLSQSQLGRVLGRNERTIRRIEKGEDWQKKTGEVPDDLVGPMLELDARFGKP